VRLIRAELLKARRRQVTYVLLIIAIVLMVATFLLVGLGLQDTRLLEFPQMYAIISQFAFGLGGLLAVVYAAAFVGADWNWGVVRNVVARGESRSNYLLAKAATLALLLALAAVLMFAIGIVMVYFTGFLYNIPVASPLRGRGLQDLLDNLVLGYPVLIQRAALGFAVAVLLRSQLAGAVIGIALYVGEAILTTVLTGLTVAQSINQSGGTLRGFQPIGPEWYQYLPISIGGNVLSSLPGASAVSGVAAGGGLGQIFLKTVPIEQALLGVVIYVVAAIGISAISLNRQEIA
jgi:ABC-type transport system involved in multi-copper enzyme maturation permease subunit